jgi:CheY-like chemotaxis protein
MLQPLAIVFYERIMPGSQLVNRLRDLGYRVMAVDQAALLVVTVRREMPLLILADLKAKSDVVEAIKTIKANPDTSHIPVIAFAPENDPVLSDAAQKTGANLAVAESMTASYLPQLLEQVLRVD